MKWYTKTGLMILVVLALFVKLVLWAIGLIPIAIVVKRVGPQSRTWPWYMQPWGNDEEGMPLWWLQASLDENWFIKRYPVWWWYAMRNVVNNSRYWFAEPPTTSLRWYTNWNQAIPMEAKQMIGAGQTSAYRWVRYKWMVGYRRVKLNLYVPGKGIGDRFVFASAASYSEFWIGWKLGSKVPGLGLTLQLRRNREIGK